MNKLLCSTTWFVVLNTVRRIVSFTATLVTGHFVNNAETNIWKIQTPKPMILSLTDTASISFLWRNANFIQHETLISFVENAKFHCARSVPQRKNTTDINMMTSKKSTQKNMHCSKENFQKFKNISYRHLKPWKSILKRMSFKLRK